MVHDNFIHQKITSLMNLHCLYPDI